MTRWLVTLATFSAMAISSCADRRQAREATQRPPLPVVETRQVIDEPIIIVTLDGVRWQEIFDGTEPARSHAAKVPSAKLMPNLYALGTERGAFLGAPGYGLVTASGPNFVSLPGYTEMFGGTARHDCADNECTRTTWPTLLDRARAAGAKVAAFAAWTKVDFALTNQPGSFPIACGPLGVPAESVSDRDACKPDYETANAALAYYESERPDVFYLGLGEPDEHAHFDDYSGYIAAIRHADDVLGRLRALLEHDDRGRRTHIFVTADHGRAANFRDHGGGMPESARTWMVVSGPRVVARGFVVSEHERHLADLAPTASTVLGLDHTEPREGGGVVLDELFLASR